MANSNSRKPERPNAPHDAGPNDPAGGDIDHRHVPRDYGEQAAAADPLLER